MSVLAALLLAPAAGGAWPTLLPETPDNGRPFAVAADAAGDVLVAGRVLAPTGDDDGLLAKLRGSDGGVVWQQTFDGSALPGAGENAAEVLRSLAITAGGDAVAAGLTVDAVSGPDLLVTRRAASNGGPMWQVPVDGGANLGDDAQGVVLDPSGDVLVTGALRTAGATLAQPAVLKLAGATGNEAWRVVLDGDGGTGRAIAADASGDAFVAGDVAAAWFVTKRAGADGAQLWRTDLAGDPGDAEAVARALALRAGGAPVVAGRLSSVASGQDFTVIALTPEGNVLWRYTLDGTAVGTADVDEAFGVAVDTSGDVVAVGTVSNAATDDDLVVVKLDGTAGTERWQVVVDGSNSNDDDASAVALTPSGDVVVVGAIRNTGSGRDLAVLLLDGETGAERWRRLVDGATGQGDVGFAGAVDGSGAVLAAGRTRNGATADGFTVLKLASATGADFPCGTGTIEEGEACDDANLALGDGCRPDCTTEACGDGIRDPQETCDDGNTDDGDCCSALCATDANGTACDDADACTHDDACAGGTCQGVETECEASNDCHAAACDPETGLCGEEPRSNGALCNDGDACTVVDECVAGECAPGGPRPCNDFDPCTADGCAPATGCTYDPFTSFAGVSCAFDPTRVATFCFAGLPRSIERRIERATSRVAKAAESAKVGRARRLLKSACGLAHQAEKRAAKQTTKGDLSPACGAALADVLPDVCARALALRDEIAAGQ